MTKHTKGPWKVDKSEKFPDAHSISATEHPDKGEHWTHLAIAFNSGGWEEDPEGKANALIMAASPDMLDALKGIRDGLQAYLETMLDMGLYVHVKLFQEKMTGLPAVVEAIAKAEKGAE